ncbi:hypothetical protein HZS_6342 [Henneguya salminicola]|nr:hypothetical protein HZS_6342 [Henneguya salminicola]
MKPLSSMPNSCPQKSVDDLSYFWEVAVIDRFANGKNKAADFIAGRQLFRAQCTTNIGEHKSCSLSD